MKFHSTLAALALAIGMSGLSSCDKIQMPDPSSKVLASIADTFTTNAFVLKFDGEMPTDIRVPKTLTAQLANGGHAIELSGKVENKRSGGPTTGLSIPLGADFEAMASGKYVKVTIAAKGATGDKMHVSYSTNDVGNSGWKSFKLGEKFAAHSFIYQVPEKKNGNNEYIGIVPGDDNTGPITIGLIAAEVVPAPDAAAG